MHPVLGRGKKSKASLCPINIVLVIQLFSSTCLLYSTDTLAVASREPVKRSRRFIVSLSHLLKLPLQLAFHAFLRLLRLVGLGPLSKAQVLHLVASHEVSGVVYLARTASIDVIPHLTGPSCMKGRP